MPLPFGLKLKRTRRYTVSSKSCLVTRIQLLNGDFVEFTLSVESTGQECLEAVAQRLELREVCACFLLAQVVIVPTRVRFVHSPVNVWAKTQSAVLLMVFYFFIFLTKCLIWNSHLNEITFWGSAEATQVNITVFTHTWNPFCSLHVKSAAEDYDWVFALHVFMDQTSFLFFSLTAAVVMPLWARSCDCPHAVTQW